MSIYGCSRYSFEINNNQIYTPTPVYNNYSLYDQRLEDCIRQAIEDHEFTQPTELVQLACSYAGIQSLEDISQFSRIQQLSLKGNPVNDGSELLKLTHLIFLDISETQILDCQLIKQLSSLLINSNPNTDLSNEPKSLNTSALIHSASC